ncbi:hypothetical protein C8263_15615 [Deinococcus arcticus]|uniref:Uncharacterized protein n=2 Tax=Deinococcus arcticus TaxID=2136176 RepID=A0A2T3W549_9DEIO|nr:hypothetical protein C8263_15615 [Deinococcus arcticus]
MTATTDAQGRIWLIQGTSTSGAVTSQLAYWAPGADDIVPAGSDVNYGYVYRSTFLISNNGRFVVFQGQEGDMATLTDTTSMATRKVDVGGNNQHTHIAVDNSGNIWSIGTGLGLRRLGLNGAVTLFNLPGDRPNQVIGFDHAQPNWLWGTGYAGASLIDVETLSNRTLPVHGLIEGLALNSQGGATLLTRNGTMTSTSYFLEYLP